MQTFDYQLDARGLVCPEPLMLARNRVREMTQGQVLLIVATDPTTDRDFENFCHFMKHKMLAKEVAEDSAEERSPGPAGGDAERGTTRVEKTRLYRYWIQKG